MENQQEQLQIKQLHIFTALTMIKRMRNQNFNPLIQDFNQHALRNKSYQHIFSRNVVKKIMGATPFYVSFIFFIFCTFALKSLFLSINLSISLSSRFHKFKTMNAVNLGMQTTLFHRFSRILPLSLIADFQELTKTHQRRCLGDTMSKPQAFTSCNALPP